ncbi:hypothetical protein [Streptomyces sp. NPDC059994]|uniref:hypothetical protein n=1 Tax=Streptomyces sp. NPDC059994 TaxID=3347029 RepID=UPI0036BBCC40
MLRLEAAAAGFLPVRPVTGPVPEWRILDARVLLFLALRRAENSRTPDTYKVATWARELQPRAVEIDILPDVSHHALPHAAPAEPGCHLTDFLSG